MSADNKTFLTSILEQSRSLDGVRGAIKERINTVGLPTAKTDGWRFSHLERIYQKNWRRAKPVSKESWSFQSALPEIKSCACIVVANECCFSETPLPTGVVLESWDLEKGFSKEAVETLPLLAALGASDPVQVELKENAAQPLHLAFREKGANDPLVFFNAVHLLIKNGVSGKVVVTYESITDTPIFPNALICVTLEHGAKLELLEVQTHGNSVYHMSSVYVTQAGDSTLAYNLLNLGGQYSRHNFTSNLCEEKAAVNLRGLSVVDNDRMAEYRSDIKHTAPACTSTQVYKGILTDAARGFFKGLICVEKNAQETNAAQVNKNLLLSNDSVIHANPHLEIYADDVKCSHGCSIGRLDDEQLFYLRARGIPEENAKAILTYAFAQDVVQGMNLYGLDKLLENAMQDVNIKSRKVDGKDRQN